MASERFASPFDIETPPGAEGWEGMYNWYHLFGPERRALDEQRFWFADRLHHPDVLHPYDEIQCECWWQALGAFNTRIFESFNPIGTCQSWVDPVCSERMPEPSLATMFPFGRMSSECP